MKGTQSGRKDLVSSGEVGVEEILASHFEVDVLEIK